MRALRGGRREEGDVRERRVDLVGHVARQATHRRESFGLEEPALQIFLLRDVDGGRQERSARAERESLDRDDDIPTLPGLRPEG